MTTPPSLTLVQDSSGLRQKEEQEEYGIYFDDDYNYLQHLQERGSTLPEVRHGEIKTEQIELCTQTLTKKPPFVFFCVARNISRGTATGHFVHFCWQ